MPTKENRMEIVCPCCQATLLLDYKTGLVLQKREKESSYSFKTALDKIHDRKERSDELFEKAFQDENRRQKNLKEKFTQAVESKDELDEPPRPLGFD